MGTQNHELVRVFAEHGLALNPTLVEMLNEHYNHRTERRGCGYTQATRYLAELINRPLSERLLDEPGALLDEPGLDPAAREASLRRINALALLEESLLLARLITDIIKPVRNPEAALVNLPYHPAKLAIGTCPMAEKFFLELVHGHVKRGGRMNILADNDNPSRPLLVEKIGLGDNHSCLSLVPLLLNGVRLPPGSLLGVSYPKSAPSCRHQGGIPGRRLSINHCDGFRFLRLTTLAVSPANRARAFTCHFQAQLDKGPYAPATTEYAQLARHAQRLLNPSTARRALSRRAKPSAIRDLIVPAR